MRPLGRALPALWLRSLWIALPAVLALLIASAWATDAAGVHAIFGAFAAGLVIPHGSRLARDLHDGIGDASLVLLPTFFASAGLRMQAGALSTASFGVLLGAVICVAFVGKVAGGALGSRVAGMAWRDALAVGALMNTRGLMELVVLQVGLDLGIISSRLFSVMVLMALATTLMTTPAVRWVLRPASGGAVAG